MAHYLMTGGTGLIGQAWIETMLSPHDQVTVLSRREKPDKKNIRYIKTLDDVAADTVIDYVINLAGKPIDCLWTDHNKQALRNSRLQTTQQLGVCLARLVHKPRLLISASAVGYYGSTDIDGMDEETIVDDQSFTHQLCHDWEQAAKESVDENTRLCIMRLGVVLSHRGGMLAKVKRPFSLGLGGRLGTGKQHFPWIHLDDVLHSMQWMIRQEDASGVYNLVAPEQVSNQDFTQQLGHVLHRPTLFHVPKCVIQGLLGEMGKTLLLEGQSVLPKRLLASGYDFKHATLQHALQQSLGA